MQPVQDTLETIENVDDECNTKQHDKIYIVCVHGNIGAGKSTYIAKQKDFVQLPEPIVEWGDKLDKYYKAVAKKPGTLSDAD